jgi:hypothetical protein
LTPAALSGLATRLSARGISTLTRDQPEIQADIRLAARLIEELGRVRSEIRRAAASTTDPVCRHHLRELIGDPLEAVTDDDLIVDVTGEDGTTRSNVPLREAIGDDAEEYDDCRKTLLADGKCTTGGGASPLHHLVLVREGR